MRTETCGAGRIIQTDIEKDPLTQNNRVVILKADSRPVYVHGSDAGSAGHIGDIESRNSAHTSDFFRKEIEAQVRTCFRCKNNRNRLCDLSSGTMSDRTPQPIVSRAKKSLSGE